MELASESNWGQKSQLSPISVGTSSQQLLSLHLLLLIPARDSQPILLAEPRAAISGGSVGPKRECSPGPGVKALPFYQWCDPE